MLLLEPTAFPVFTQSQAALLPDGEICLSMHLEAWQDWMNFASSAQSNWAFTSCTPQQHHGGRGGAGNGPKSAGQSVFGRYCRLTTCMATDVFSLALLVLPSLTSSEQSHFLWESLSTPPPPRLRKHCRQTEPTSSPLPFLGEGNDLQWTLWGQRPQQTLINCVIYCLTRLCMEPSHVPV